MEYAQYASQYSAGIPFSMREFSRETLDSISSSDPAMSKMKASWIKVFDNVDKVREQGINLYAYGDHGAGKTMCAAILVKEASKHGLISQYLTLPNLVNIALNSPDRRDALMRVDFLIIDDVKSPIDILTDKTILLYASVLDQFFTSRFEAELPTIMLSDTTLESIIDSYGLQRVRSSLTSKRTKKILHVGEDYRKTGELNV
jgi:DNA replication protein DnaC